MKFKSIQLMFLCVMVFLLNSSLVAQLNTDISGIYSFKKESYQENIELRNDGMFFYNVSMEFINLKVSGYWNIQHDSILLSSKPFYERMLVWESRKKKKVYEVFVTDKKEYTTNLKQVGAVYRQIMGKHFPATALVEISALVEDLAKVEIEAIAVI